jgi:hypothetical protein
MFSIAVNEEYDLNIEENVYEMNERDTDAFALHAATQQRDEIAVAGEQLDDDDMMFIVSVCARAWPNGMCAGGRTVPSAVSGARSTHTTCQSNRQQGPPTGLQSRTVLMNSYIHNELLCAQSRLVFVTILIMIISCNCA